MEDTEFTYDSVDNPVEIRDWRLPNEWPAGAKPVSRKAEYDDLYRLTRLDYQYSSGDDEWVSPFAAEVGTHPAAWGAPPPNGDLADPRRAQPSPHLSFSKRVQRQTYAYDWLGNTTASDDDAHGFYDRSLGVIENGGNGAGPYQLTGASNVSGGTATARRGNLSTRYDEAGNLVDLAVNRATPGGECLPTGTPCNQRFLYAWDEVGRLSRARRWDTTNTGTAGDAEPAGPTAAELRYGYDGGEQRVVKTAVDDDGDERHTVYVVASLELRRTAWDEQEGDYALTPLTEVGYLLATGVRLGRLHFDEKEVPTLGTTQEGSLHVLLELADHLGSGNTVLDKATGELAEKMTYQGYGSTESDYRPGRWAAMREDYRFTGKEEDSEVGLMYFGFRYLNMAIGRWVSADPLAVHGAGADLNTYAYVRGRLLQAVDPTGLDDLGAGERAKKFKDRENENLSKVRSLVLKIAGAKEGDYIHNALVIANLGFKAGDYFNEANRILGNPKYLYLKAGFLTRSLWLKSNIHPVVSKFLDRYMDASGETYYLTQKEATTLGIHASVTRNSGGQKGVVNENFISHVRRLKEVAVALNEDYAKERIKFTSLGDSHIQGGLGTFTVIYQGVLTVRKDGFWHFEGSMQFYDEWDFDAGAKGRSKEGQERLNIAREYLPGSGFAIISPEMPVSESAGDGEIQWEGTGKSAPKSGISLTGKLLKAIKDSVEL